MSWERNLEFLEEEEESKKAERNTEERSKEEEEVIIETKQDLVRKLEETMNSYEVMKGLEMVGENVQDMKKIIIKTVDRIVDEGIRKKLISDEEKIKILKKFEIGIREEEKNVYGNNRNFDEEER